MITNLKHRDSYADDDLVCIMLYCVQVWHLEQNTVIKLLSCVVLKCYKC